MKRTLLLSLLTCLLLCAGCNNRPATIPSISLTEESFSAPETEAIPVPPMLIGMWRSASPGELDMIETITIEEDGSISVNCVYQGRDAGTIYGTWYLISDKILHCDMTANGAPYILDYRFELDGRELILFDEDGAAHYIKVS